MSRITVVLSFAAVKNNHILSSVDLPVLNDELDKIVLLSTYSIMFCFRKYGSKKYE